MSHALLQKLSASALAVLATAVASADPFGIVAHTPKPEITAEIEAAGIEWVRIDFLWSLVELEQNRFDWSLYDDLVGDLEARGMKVFATLQATPAWATAGREFSGVPSDPSDWKDFCYLAARRYRGRIHAWGLWNEANLDRFWDGTRSEYIQEILIAGAESIRAADPSALICAPDLAHLTSANWFSWLAEIIQDAGDLIDVISHHAYPSSILASDVRDKLEGDQEWPWDPPSLQAVLDGSDWGDRSVWLTETGLESDILGESTQRAFYREFLEDWFPEGRNQRWLERVFFYQMVDNPQLPEITFGILSAPPEFERKLAFEEYRSFIADSELDDALLVAVRVPETVTPLAANIIELELENTGRTTWRRGEVRLVVGKDVEDWTLRGGRWNGPDEIAPGDHAFFELTLEPPPGWRPSPPYSMHVFARLERQNQWFFGSSLWRRVLVTPYGTPEIRIPPRSQAAVSGSTARFSIQAVSERFTLSYRWRRNSVPLRDGPQVEGSATPRLVLHDVDDHLPGFYDCEVTSLVSSTVSPSAELRLADQPGPLEGPRRSGGTRSPSPKQLEVLERYTERMLRDHAR